MKTLVLLILAFVLLSLLGHRSGEAVPLSDLAEEQFEKGPSVLTSTPRSPFVPSYRAAEDVDVSTLQVQGIIDGKRLKMALLSGRVVREGEKLGRYTVDKMDPEGVVLSFESSLYRLKLENYVAPVGKKKGGGFTVELRNAALRDALRFLAKASDLNLIMPEDLGGRVTLSFDDIELLEAIRSILRVNGYEYALEAGVLRVGRPDAFAGGTDLRTQSFRLKYATAKDLTEKVKLLLSDRGSVIADDRTNTLTVKDRDPIVQTIAGLMSQIDKRDLQVQIEARIVDASRNFSRSLGVRWGVSGQKDNVQVGGTQSAGTNPDTTNPLNVNLGATDPTSGLGLIIGRIAGALNIEAQLTAAEQKGDIEILAKPSVTTLNNIPAKIRSGTKIYVKSTSSINVGTGGGNAASAATSGLQEIETGITLTVTPQISTDDYIKMRIEATQSEADFSRTVDGIPSVIDSNASTTVILRDGETTVIGGLSRQRTSREKRGVPGLQRIPVLGHLFQSKTRTRADSELIIFITPKIVGS